MTGLEYEYAVAQYLRNIGYYDVTVTPGSGDYGVDVIAYKDGHKYAIQCKYYSQPLGQDPVREVVAGMAVYNCDQAMVVTNTGFTKAARRLAAINGVILLDHISEAGVQVYARADVPVDNSPSGALWLVCLVILGIVFYGAYDLSRGKPPEMMIWFWFCMIAGVTSPFWIWWILRMIWRLLYKGIKILINKIDKKHSDLSNQIEDGDNYSSEASDDTENTEENAEAYKEIEVTQAIIRPPFSTYSGMPRMLIINGYQYDIDDPVDIKEMPLFIAVATVGEKKYDMASLFYEHSFRCADAHRPDLNTAAYKKAVEFEQYQAKKGFYLQPPKGLKEYWDDRNSKIDDSELLRSAIKSYKPDERTVIDALHNLKVSSPVLYYDLYEAVRGCQKRNNVVSVANLVAHLGRSYAHCEILKDTMKEMGLTVHWHDLPLKRAPNFISDDYLVITLNDFEHYIDTAEIEDG